MTKDSGALSIDFIVGFTIFLIAFIWVVSLVPGLLINLQGFTIDYDAVAYRTGVILVEDPGLRQIRDGQSYDPGKIHGNSRLTRETYYDSVLQYHGILPISFQKIR